MLAVVVLPLESQVFARAADAVLRGFLTAAKSDKADGRVSVVGYGDGGLDGALVAARFAEPEWIVGPLTREDVTALSRQVEPLPPVLALNQPDDPAMLPAQVLTFSLAAEGESRQAAMRMKADGVRSCALIVGNGPLQHRLAAAFEAEWLRQGGSIASRHAVADSTVGKRLREEIRRNNPDAVFLALDSTDAQRVRPALGLARIYATSQVYEGQDETLLRDLDGVRFFGMPWIVQPDASALATYSRDETGNASLDRLYAFGIDAFRLLWALRNTGDPSLVSVDGVTGHIALAAPRQFGRDGVLTEIRDGRLVPLTEP
jgi:outer membrane PBP1 activator LpoA protein